MPTQVIPVLVVAAAAAAIAAAAVPRVVRAAVADPGAGRTAAPRHNWLTRPVVTAPVTAVVTAALTWQIGWSPLLAAVLLFGAAAVCIAIIDLQYLRVPDRIVVPAIAVGVALLSTAAAVDEQWQALGTALLACIAAAAIALLAHHATAHGVGGGDVPLVALAALHLGWFGWGVVVTGIVYGVVVTFLVAVVVLLSGAGRRSSIPLAPPLLLATLITIATVGG